LQALLDEFGVLSGGGMPLRLIEQPPRAKDFDARYEVRLFQTGELPLREANWHDFFNVLSWLAYPRAKAALNARHHLAALAQRETGARNRAPLQDALTLFDEGGIIVASSEADLLDDLRAFRWKRLFWERRQAVESRMSWRVAGHALFEKALAPYVGVTGRGLLIEVDHAFHAWTPHEQRAHLDQRAAAWMASPRELSSARDLTPVPVLGVPGWWPANEDPAFYEDRAYFRQASRPPAARPRRS
jgi:hypothetical protein